MMRDKQMRLEASSAATAMVSITIAYPHGYGQRYYRRAYLTTLRCHASDGKRVKVSSDRRHVILLLITEDMHHTFEVDHLKRLTPRHGRQ